ncbi:3-keto-5-aminohexanoate cleavage protein [Corallococcus exiguus]|uniref:3-keto-5-aminohexanoate cleavage enzyme n=1 Tax=Corallococcus TaxID=83461 RepID=UPI000EA2B2CF|nr:MULTISPECIES: 3-keto-5-aminohexanoate cleavage protein [Corallococcus]NNC19181.1 3-keto-5-aminohexanoate cleavage protein [Corallococcus exiguus]NPC69440.1 3-keto-5-aminohexanoate cleavage protein [Corallococcus exiguus]NRD44620.1 3-keto-5-aminohexanoate cleavage protein [Corallococcus exiguus]NRD52768.1 3-keto-5-aminohexanoate cleavage protein [Corallococcus exiguus]NRD63029.1 3-keto-5-aminohexanoate cleavage protein [Corallococcus exiguus]
MSRPMVLTAALVGAETTREQTPYLPITAEEIAEDAAKCREAGAAMVHIHVRTAEGKPSQDAELFRAAIRAIRKRTDVLVQVSTGGAVGMGVDERCGGLTLTGADKPDMATLTTGTVNFGEEVFWNPRPLVRDIAKRIKSIGLKPELECFDVGMIDEARYLAKEGLVELPAHFDFVLGVPGTLQARPEVLDFMIASLPEGSSWTVAGVGRQQLPFVEEAAKRGGNARVGLEDNIYLSKGVLAKGNFELVAEAAKRARAAGREIASPEQARQLLRLG